jgi:hypothetical protein
VFWAAGPGFVYQNRFLDELFDRIPRNVGYVGKDNAPDLLAAPVVGKTLLMGYGNRWDRNDRLQDNTIFIERAAAKTRSGFYRRSPGAAS